LLALMVGETHNAQMLRVSGHFSAVLDSDGSLFALVLCTSVRRSSNGAICKRSHREASTGSGNMTTLYDLLGALPGDDADDLRKAFREAVKGTHPDIRPNDPEAALNFRLIIHAMEILGDPDQRAAYDHLLELARRELEQEQRAARIRNFAFAMIGLRAFRLWQSAYIFCSRRRPRCRLRLHGPVSFPAGRPRLHPIALPPGPA
jgi:DnaJ-like protein